MTVHASNTKTYVSHFPTLPVEQAGPLIKWACLAKSCYGDYQVSHISSKRVLPKLSKDELTKSYGFKVEDCGEITDDSPVYQLFQNIKNAIKTDKMFQGNWESKIGFSKKVGSDRIYTSTYYVNQKTGNIYRFLWDPSGNNLVIVPGGTTAGTQFFKGMYRTQMQGNFATQIKSKTLAPEMKESLALAQVLATAVCDHNLVHPSKTPLKVVFAGHSRGGAHSRLMGLSIGAQWYAFNSRATTYAEIATLNKTQLKKHLQMGLNISSEDDRLTHSIISQTGRKLSDAVHRIFGGKSRVPRNIGPGYRIPRLIKGHWDPILSHHRGEPVNLIAMLKGRNDFAKSPLQDSSKTIREFRQWTR